MKKKLLIVGAGLSGAYSYHQLKDKYDVSVIEIANRIGGKCHSDQDNKGIVYEKGAAAAAVNGSILNSLLKQYHFKTEPSAKNNFFKLDSRFIKPSYYLKFTNVLLLIKESFIYFYHYLIWKISKSKRYDENFEDFCKKHNLKIL